MSSYGGYAGKILKIDLSRETITEYPWSDALRRATLGGKAMAARILADHLTGRETALCEGSCAVITTGPLTGSGAPGSSRFDIAALSPKDDLPAFSNCGGDFGVFLKKAGYDALILTGRCPEPRWLEIREGRVLFHDGTALWGSDTGACQDALGRWLDTEHFGRLCIGPAGENLVKIASVIGNGHAAGRAGIGAVLGSKNLKAVTVTGCGRIPLFDPEQAAVWNRQWHAALARRAAGAPEKSASRCGSCPLRCNKPLHGERRAILDELGLDCIAAEDAAAWAASQGLCTDGFYQDLAHRRGIAGALADALPQRQKTGARRRRGSGHAIAEAFSLPPDDPETERFCRELTEAVSSAGQCMFTLNVPPPAGCELPALVMLRHVTGMALTFEELLAIGRASLALENTLRRRFQA